MFGEGVAREVGAAERAAGEGAEGRGLRPVGNVLDPNKHRLSDLSLLAHSHSSKSIPQKIV